MKNKSLIRQLPVVMGISVLLITGALATWYTARGGMNAPESWMLYGAALFMSLLAWGVFRLAGAFGNQQD